MVATLAVTAIIVSHNNQKYHYDSGVYYVEASGGYNVVPPPVNITVVTIPEEKEPITYNDETYYYYAGTFYTKSSDWYTVIKAPDGAIVTNIPDGAEEEEIDGSSYVVYNDIYCQPLSQDGNDMYQVVAMEDQ